MNQDQEAQNDETESRKNTEQQETIQARNASLTRNLQIPKIHRVAHNKGTIPMTGEKNFAERTWGPSYPGWGSAGIA